MTTNIGDISDPFYRYKRPTVNIENRTNKTVITNIEEVAKALHTKAAYIMYYIQLGKSVPTTPKGDIQGAIKKIDIENLINTFINQYILCKKCNYPELVIKKNGSKLYFSCDACGSTEDIPENKFTKIIYKDYK